VSRAVYNVGGDAGSTTVRRRGLSNARFKGIGIVLVAMSALGSAVVARGMPADLTTADFSQLTFAVLLEALSWMAFPIYAWLLCSGFTHTRSVPRYGIQLAVLAVVSEVPYDLASTGHTWDMSSQSPVWALVISLVVLSTLKHLRDRRPAGYVFFSVVVCLAAFLWLGLFNVGLRYGILPGGMVILAFVLVFFFLQRRENTMMLVAAVIGAFALIFPAAGLAFVHFRNGMVGSAQTKWFFYAAYPLVLLVVGLLGAMT
jgi:hypothetical protein